MLRRTVVDVLTRRLPAMMAIGFLPVVARKSLLERRAGLRFGERGHDLSFRYEIPEFVEEVAEQVHELSLADLFESESPWESQLVRHCASDLLRQRASSISEDCVESPEEYGFTIDDLRAFTLSPTGISFYFSPYHVGCWAEGVYSVRIPWAAIRDCLSDESPARLFMAIDSR